MSDAWKSYRGAPKAGALICKVKNIPVDDTLCVELEGFPIVLVQISGEIRAYVNACPHQYLPLNHKGNRLISADKKILRCTNHSAGFSVETGQGVEGLAVGRCLDPIPVNIADEEVRVGVS